jgi:hypothetical protein
MVKHAFLLLLVVGCAVDNPPTQVGALDREYFRCNVQPVLAARCAFPACHGTRVRPLAIFAPGRERLRVTWDRPTEAVTQDELDANFKLVTGFTTLDATGEPWLLSKPLATSAGGYYHRGADLYGSDDVFMTKDDAGYQKLEKWIAGETAQPTCAPTTMVGP